MSPSATCTRCGFQDESFIAFGAVSSLVAFGTTLVITIWISSQIWMYTIGSSWVPQVHRLSLSQLVSGGLGDTAT
ncbi:hypothetical protein A2U01_0030930 [Trifolium medium]|uniref:Uncharacterized protein n=1 Tax=Trifolium medium TaxID=97028 RepID=A0A392PED7_9FABA|nr:hypothetical protein [Trifolium medium]